MIIKFKLKFKFLILYLLINIITIVYCNKKFILKDYKNNIINNNYYYNDKIPERIKKDLLDFQINHKNKNKNNLQSTNAPMLNMNCNNLTGYACELYILEYLNEYIYVNKSYNRLIVPTFNKSNRPIDVVIIITFVDLININTITGTITTSVFIDYFWNDCFMHWNSELTDGNNFILINNDLLWIPDIALYNAIDGFYSSIDSAAVFLSSDGTVWWSGRGVTTFSCTFDVTDFPFDSHTCTAEYASWIYSINNINITQVNAIVLDTFQNLAWKVNSVKGERKIIYLWNGQYKYPFGLFHINITRYYEHYVSSAIYPSIIITSIVLSSLYMGNDYGNRLALSVTGFLTIIAIQVNY